MPSLKSIGEELRQLSCPRTDGMYNIITVLSSNTVINRLNNNKPGKEPCCFEELTVDVKERVED